MNGKAWTQQELDYLIAHYADEKTDNIARHLNRNIYSVYNKVFALQLKKSPAYLEKRQQKWVGSLIENGKKKRFKKGHTPWNKDKKGLQIGGELTQFKNGHLPHNTRYDGATRVDKDGYIMQRVALGKWRPKQRVVWEKHYGPVPKNYIVTFKDGNKLNFAIDNLELISRSENMKRNSFHRYPRELKFAIRTLNKLNKTIANHEKQD